MAEGNPTPSRVIDGQKTGLARTMHGIAVDNKRNEIVVPNPFAEALLFFRADASGEQPPLRVIQGPKTLLVGPQALALDSENGEVYVPSQKGILVFKSEGNGDVAPVRVLRGPKTKLTTPMRVAVDPKNNVVVVINDNNPPALAIFNRTDDGDVAPQAYITGEKTGIIRAQYVDVDPTRKLIFAALSDVNSRYQQYTERAEYIGIGVWSYSDDGNVAPRFAIRGKASRLGRPRGLAVNPKDKEVYVTDMTNNALFTFILSDAFN